ncbi:MAG: UDP-N-acetylglucosamine 2-epimerase (non-hydrolyzing) [Parcubacteria group bacterium]|nr:UDP-N-acetylglucosamine 2-epimerase (non-hydrolyzing) [Parcubacteria group bacterium]
MKKKVACCYGTRPEFIKLAPVVLELKKRKTVAPVLICSGQHEELLRGIGEDFVVKPDFELDVRKKIGNSGDLSELAAGLLRGFGGAFRRVKPDAVMVQGDAASAAFAALAAFHRRLPVYYIEAGLRTYDLSAPFPEEGYRQMISRMASVLFCPTDIDRENLIQERVPRDKIYVVGNTVIDALRIILKSPTLSRQGWTLRDARQGRALKNKIVVTLHRRENWGQPMRRILAAFKKIAAGYPEYEFVVSVHPNPIVKAEVESSLKNLARFTLINPPAYKQFIQLLAESFGVITDSGGIQEESPTLGIPCLVVRDKTERLAGIKLGWSFLAGTGEDKIISGFEWLIDWKRPKGGNPYGDGKASGRIADVIEKVWK